MMYFDTRPAWQLHFKSEWRILSIDFAQEIHFYRFLIDGTLQKRPEFHALCKTAIGQLFVLL